MIQHLLKERMEIVMNEFNTVSFILGMIAGTNIAIAICSILTSKKGFHEDN